ncbi:Polyisoprenoid-binding protein YceI [Chitinophaga rupis]|uniref:Polyisoprenoid-binding protein YceI n=1 Tax=Chitinophaga rupis TaxID=573321 RepID=A0A1H7I9E9_9BACT|nr:YceI family protein [Chitinophaga rupis]SEK59193.1 Polyisoprenoid-binding protein YceI [Chitinophaga rupis]
MQYAASFASIGVIVILIAYTVQSTVTQVNKLSPFTTGTVQHSNRLFNSSTAVKPTIFLVDKTNSTLTWTARKVSGQHTGNIRISDGTLELDNNQLQRGSFELDTRSITVTDLKDADSNARLTGHLKSDDFFAVEKFPAANFTINSVTPVSGNQHKVTGKLTIKGITHDISFPATVTINGSKLSAKALVKIDRTRYDIKFRSKSFFENLGDKAIYDDFDLDITLLASAQ